VPFARRIGTSQCRQHALLEAHGAMAGCQSGFSMTLLG